jgi:hypothetical protein
MKSFTWVLSSILMEWSLFVRYNIQVALWLLKNFFNTCHTSIGSKRSPTIRIRLSLIAMIRLVRALSFLDCSKVASFVCCTSIIVAYCIVTSSTALSSQTTTCAWTMVCTIIIVTTTSSIGQTNSHSPSHLSGWRTLTFQMPQLLVCSSSFTSDVKNWFSLMIIKQVIVYVAYYQSITNRFLSSKKKKNLLCSTPQINH